MSNDNADAILQAKADECLRLYKQIDEKNAEIERLKARVEFLEKGMEQAIRILKYKDPELLDEMKEYGDINFSDFADYLKEKENG